ncbi:molybdenum ABC transporter ATP-binding protein [Ectothiorhodospiraceae bacterium WFHF3C12]|nr:molybdenum ABC transporter ATP-binding protein [Ectothiorhodospiraceae bacterium WFHF3C12]
MSLEARLSLRRPGFLLDAALSLPERGVTTVFGPSGSGKTTLLRCLAGLERPAGELALGGEYWQRDGYFLPAHRRRVGMVFQDGRLFPHLTVRGNLRFAMRRAGCEEAAMDAPVALMGIERLLARRPDTLSGGEVQRVAVARALLSQPRLLLLDEPLAAVDARRKQEILPFLERLTRELALPVVHVSHSLDEVIRLADRLVLMDEGRVVASGGVTEMFSRLDLPLAQREDVGAVLEAHAPRPLPGYHLTEATVAGQKLLLPGESAEPGERLRVRIRARDVSLTLKPPSETSILNVLPGRITEVVERPDAPGQRLVRVAVGDAALLSWVSRLSAERLALAPGQAVYAQVKAVALA